MLMANVDRLLRSIWTDVPGCCAVDDLGLSSGPVIGETVLTNRRLSQEATAHPRTALLSRAGTSR
jgi:hypothetical protein